ncbi:perlucin-like protein isoform X1 [Dreissena polymorpha]|uniref:perlucin-like protein isoform X1 n=1 Tax=Dreissena polymorpha TaxID=45954 RepID=UPI002264056E|nr:perlucin-like protein isoform X1 [Dreissena polymorpha]
MKGILTSIFILLYTAEIFVSGTTTCCPNDYLSFLGSCYHFGRNPYSFVESEHYCQQHGGHLVHINNAMENDYLKDHVTFMKVGYTWWIGLTDELVEGHFMWRDDDSIVTYSDWDNDQPNGGPEDCVGFYNKGEGNGFRWHDLDCGNRGFYPICESSQTEPEVIVGK